MNHLLPNCRWLARIFWSEALFFKRGFMDGVAGCRLASLKRR